jgi:hypothetical protein
MGRPLELNSKQDAEKLQQLQRQRMAPRISVDGRDRVPRDTAHRQERRR